MRLPRTRSTRGISTAEVLVGTALSLMAVLAIYAVFRAQTSAFAAQNRYAQSQLVTRSFVDLFTRELRMAGYDPTGGAVPNTVGACPSFKNAIVSASDTSITFRADLNGDGALTAAGEVVTYDLSGTQIRRTDGAGAPVVLVDNVPANGLRFRYYDGSNPPNQLAAGGGALTQNDLNCTTKVGVTVQSQVAYADSGPMTSTAESEVAIRNKSLANF